MNRVIELVEFALAARESGRRTLAAVYLRQARSENRAVSRLYPSLRARIRLGYSRTPDGHDEPAPRDSQVPPSLKARLGLN